MTEWNETADRLIHWLSVEQDFSTQEQIRRELRRILFSVTEPLPSIVPANPPNDLGERV